MTKAKEMIVFKDKLGKPIEPGCYIAYGHALGRCAGLRIGMVLAVKTIKSGLARPGYSDVRITVIGVDDDWRDDPLMLNNRTGTLMFPDRVIVLSPKSIPAGYRKLFQQYKKDNPA
jgi:hypothetical protein